MDWFPRDSILLNSEYAFQIGAPQRERLGGGRNERRLVCSRMGRQAFLDLRL